MVWYSPRSETYAVQKGDLLVVRGPDVAADLSGAWADDFLRAFVSETQSETQEVGKLIALERSPMPAHRGVVEVARRGGAQPWVPLSASGTAPILFLEVLGRCNERCVHCYASSGPDVEAALPREVCLDVIRDAAAAGFGRLQLTGGDPLLCAFLPELARAARDAGMSEVEIYTNGLALTSDRLAELEPARVRFAFSFYSHDPQVHDAITGVAGSQRRTLRAIGEAAQRGARVRVGVVQMAQNATGLEETRQLLIEQGVAPEAIWVDTIHQVGRGSAEAAAIAGAERGAHGGAPTETGQPAKWPGKACVAYTGEVYPCIFARSTRLGSVLEESLATILDRARSRREATVSWAQLPSQLACLDCRLTVAALAERLR